MSKIRDRLSETKNSNDEEHWKIIYYKFYIKFQENFINHFHINIFCSGIREVFMRWDGEYGDASLISYVE